MKVAFFTNDFPGQVNTFISRDIKALIDDGMEVHVFSLYPENAAHRNRIPSFLSKDMLPWERIHYVGGRSWILKAVWTAATRPRIGGVALRILCSAVRFGLRPLVKTAYALLKGIHLGSVSGGDFDFVLSYWGNYAATAALLFRNAGVPRAKFGFFLHAGIDLYRDQVFLRQKIEAADVVFTVSEFNVRFIRNLYPHLHDVIRSKVHVHHLGLDIKRLKVVFDGRAPATLLGVGYHHRHKGFEFVVRAAARVKAHGYPVKLELLGEGPETPRLKQLAVELGIGPDVVFCNWKPIEEVLAHMQAATLLVHASPHIGDCVPTVIKEAMAVGLPVVASDVAGIPELLDGGRCGVLVPPRDVDQLAAAIERLLASPALRTELATRARQFGEVLFDQERNGARLAALVRQTTQA